MKKQETTQETSTPPVGNDEMAEYVTGIADSQTTARVLRAALTDSAARATLQALIARDENARRATQIVESADARTETLKARMRATAIAVARETPLAADIPVAVLEKTSAARLWERVLQTGQALLTLPCLAPATAASASAQSPLHRQTIQTGDGVHIEFQQLPGDPPYRLRAIVDASQLQAESGESAESAPYDVAYLTLEEGDSAQAAPPARHLLIVPLNAQTRGYADFVVGGSGPGGIAIPLSTCRLVSATLSHTAPAATSG